MGVLYNVLFPNGGGGSSSSSSNSDSTAANANKSTSDSRPTEQPEWVLDRRDGGSSVWRRYELSARHVKFLDEVQVKVFERDEWDAVGGSDDVSCTGNYRGGGDDDDNDNSDNDGDDFPTTSWTDTDDCRWLCEGKMDDDDTIVLIVSVTVLGLCIGLAYLFTPVNWLLQQFSD